MDTIKLNNNNAAFQLHGNVNRHSLKLFKVKQEHKNGQSLQLQVIDEKDMTMFTQDLNSENGETEIDKKFVFYDHITVRVECKKTGQPFELVVYYE